MGIILAWLIGESIVGYRWAKNGAPPPPGAIAAASVIFLGCAVLGTYQPAKTTATVFAFGVDLAVLLKVLPGGNASQVTNWPPDHIPCGTLLPKAGAGMAAPPDCGGGALSSTSGGRNPGTTPLAGTAAPGTPPLGYGPAPIPGAKPKNGKCPPGMGLSPNGKDCVPLVSGQVG
jgi:hypothetical protein